MSISGLTLSPEMVQVNTAYDSDCARVLWDYVRRSADEGRTIQVTAVERSFSPAEVAAMVDVSRQTVQRRIADGTIRASRRGSRWRVSEAEVNRYRFFLADQMARLVADDLDF
jgi:excisionase family DNA binding protein